MTATPDVGIARIAADPVFAGAGVKGERSESRSDAVGALDAWSGDHIIGAAGDAERAEPSGAPLAPLSGTGRTRYLTIVEAAAYLNVSVRFIRGQVTERRVRFHKVGRLVRFDTADLDAFVETVEVAAGQTELADRVWWSARRLG